MFPPPLSRSFLVHRDNASVVVDNSSSGRTSNATFSADGDLTTVWEASSSTNEWVTLDLGSTREVTAVRVQVSGGRIVDDGDKNGLDL